MQLKIDEKDLLILKDINDPKINKYLSKIENINEDTYKMIFTEYNIKYRISIRKNS